MRIKNLVLHIEASGSTPIAEESDQWKQLMGLYALGEQPAQIILTSNISMWEKHPALYTEFLVNLNERFPDARLDVYGTQGNESQEHDAVMVNYLEKMPDTNPNDWNVLLGMKHGESCLNPVKNYKASQQTILGPNLMLEINFGDAGGAPIAHDHYVWRYLQHLYSSTLQPQKIVLISETKMREGHPDEYRRFLVKLREVFPGPAFFYIGKSNNHTVSEVNGEVDYAAEPVVLWGGSVHTKQRTEKVSKPEHPWHFVTHCFNSDNRKKTNIRRVLGITEKDNLTEYKKFVFLHFPEEVARWPVENAATRIQAAWHGYATRLYVTALKQQRLLPEAQSANCMPIFLLFKNIMSSLLGTPESANKNVEEQIMQHSRSIFNSCPSSITPISFESMDDEEHKEEKTEADLDEATHSNLPSPNSRLMSWLSSRHYKSSSSRICPEDNVISQLSRPG